MNGEGDGENAAENGRRRDRVVSVALEVQGARCLRLILTLSDFKGDISVVSGESAGAG